ncbi:cytochrome P450 [Coniophora puteana RWD-64-598 SS2]|uniref:Cytochrome P450 n=1 Tax=Coniophora puteana (strain RWD-64-598) TaxID=741705 RepID=A0A5M3N3K6_CONPW|nr:cytochrome P450 [Coniophora puteana RWD-64-598 SS2]EIW85926.1 cytochrome P450 [Coniophora puteana RWD-64-598 SS2]
MSSSALIPTIGNALESVGASWRSLGALVLLVLAGSFVRGRVAKRGLPLPPGPPGHWLFGNKLPHVKQSQVFARWIEEYGPIIKLRTGPRTIIIIGRYQPAVDIMEKEGQLLADRPRAVAAGEILSRGLRMILAPAGEQFRRLRRAAHTHLQAKAAESYAPIQMAAARDVIVDLLDAPRGHMEHVERYAASVILKITYGATARVRRTDPEIVTIHKMLGRFQMLMRPGSLLIERYPFLKHLPGFLYKWNTEIEEWRREEKALFEKQIERVERDIDEGSAGPSFARYLLEREATVGEGDESGQGNTLSKIEKTYLAGSLFGAGSDTTAVALQVVIMAAAHHPEAQRTIQKELDAVVGRDRAPTFDDQPNLPQIQAFILECLRWRPVTTLGFAHRALKDIIYKGMLIPEGAVVFGNHWAISRDASVYPDPHTFDPQRWLTPQGEIREDLKFPSFGFGRRICPGQHIALRSIYINAALIMWAFNLSESKTQPIDVDAFVDGVVAHPKPFEVVFEPRVGGDKEGRGLRRVMEGYGEEI